MIKFNPIFISNDFFKLHKEGNFYYKIVRLLVSFIDLHRMIIHSFIYLHRLSKAYFSKRPEIKDGCYFLVSAKWLRKWRNWLLRDLTSDVNGTQCEFEYHNIQEIQFSCVCPHSKIVVPGYMDHFIRGYSSLPCVVKNTII